MNICRDEKRSEVSNAVPENAWQEIKAFFDDLYQPEHFVKLEKMDRKNESALKRLILLKEELYDIQLLGDEISESHWEQAKELMNEIGMRTTENNTASSIVLNETDSNAAQISEVMQTASA